MGRGWKNSEEDDRKKSDCLKHMISRNTDVNNHPTEDSEESKDYGREHIYHLKKYWHHPKWTVSKNINIKATAGEGSD